MSNLPNWNRSPTDIRFSLELVAMVNASDKEFFAIQ
jgi:hypothetical protein